MTKFLLIFFSSSTTRQSIHSVLGDASAQLTGTELRLSKLRTSQLLESSLLTRYFGYRSSTEMADTHNRSSLIVVSTPIEQHQRAISHAVQQIQQNPPSSQWYRSCCNFNFTPTPLHLHPTVLPHPQLPPAPPLEDQIGSEPTGLESEHNRWNSCYYSSAQLASNQDRVTRWMFESASWSALAPSPQSLSSSNRIDQLLGVTNDPFRWSSSSSLHLDPILAHNLPPNKIATSNAELSVDEISEAELAQMSYSRSRS